METNKFVLADVAVGWIRRWQEMKPAFCVNAFTIPISDLGSAFEEEHFKTIRVYFGLTESNEMKLVVVGTDHNNNDILVDASLEATLKTKGGRNKIFTNVTDARVGCFDVCRPCPPMCGTSLLTTALL
ncbi:hypothetical protein [Chitinophaga solisilvae]|uniref:hypothetical protein n=1 Tax=Chitinophaga solisilvae TaxID=1233460 RepID=UPI00136D82B3|nr:hypothetical protein [Chitinophaga solisilvae]